MKLLGCGMSDWWGTLQLTIDDSPGSVLVDLGACEDAPDRTRPISIRVRMPLKNPRPDGFWTPDEGPDLEAIEKSIPTVFRERLNAVYVGRATSKGLRDFYLYAPSLAGLKDAMAELRRLHPTYQFSAASGDDPEWETYLNFLYPDPLNFQLMLSEDTIEGLRELGDDESLDRELTHWTYFPRRTNLDGFFAAAKLQGYRARLLDSDASDPADERCVIVEGVSRGGRLGIQDSLVKVFGLVTEHGGRYDGFESPVMEPDVGPGK